MNIGDRFTFEDNMYEIKTIDTNTVHASKVKNGKAQVGRPKTFRTNEVLAILGESSEAEFDRPAFVDKDVWGTLDINRENVDSILEG